MTSLADFFLAAFRNVYLLNNKRKKYKEWQRVGEQRQGWGKQAHIYKNKSYGSIENNVLLSMNS